MAETGASAVIRALCEEGIKLVFGMPGLHTLAFWDAFARHPEMRAVVTRHEQAAAFAADGYARASGRPAAVIAITGPGATNTLTGVATAYVDSVPMVVITGEVDSKYAGRDCETLHELPDQRAIFASVTGFSRRVMRIEDLAPTVREAFVAMRGGRPRPVHIDVPIDLQRAEATPAESPARRITRPGPDPACVDQVAAMLAVARRPILYCGGGAVSSAQEVQRLAETLGSAVITTATARGIVPDDHPLSLGNAWAKATRDGPAADFLRSCDVMLALGASFGGNPTGHWTLPVPEKLIQVDVSPAVLGRHYPTMSILAAAETFVPILLEALEAYYPAAVDRRSFHDDIARTVEAIQSTCRPEARAVLDSIRTGVGREGIVVNDETAIAYNALTYLPVYAPRTFLSSAKFGTLGYGLPAAIGAKIGRPDCRVVAICGDGGLLLNCHELATAVQENLALAVLVHNDRGYGAIRHSQDHLYDGRRVGVDLHTPDMRSLAESFGLRYLKPSDPQHLREGIEGAMVGSGPTLIEWVNYVPFPW